MRGLGTIINAAAIVVGGLLGLVFKRFIKESMQETLLRATGACVMILGIGGAMAEMLSVENDLLTTRGSLMMILCFVLGSFAGELMDTEGGFVRLGIWLRKKSGNAGDHEFLVAFLNASLTVCIGAMAIVGSIQDGLTGDYSMLAAKAVLDFVIVMVLAASMGKGAVFSAVPVAVLQGTVTALAGLLAPVMTAKAISNLSFTGSVLIFCVGVNLVWDKRFKTANMLPAIVFAVIYALVFPGA